MTTIRFPSAWIAKAHDAFAGLAEKPWTLFWLMLAVNTVALPYAGITHDARLYSVQVLNQVEDGAYADDLFFRYGSQDQYSLFSRLAAPLVRWLGLAPAFFVLYLISKSLLIFGMIRLVHTLVPNRTASTLALIYCMAITIPYSGHHILNVQEMFLTPRMPASALVLIGLDMLLRGRPMASFLVLAFALVLHPLMAFGGVLIWAGCCAWKYLGGRLFLGALITACILVSAILIYEPLGKRIFGEMDDPWRQTIRHASSFNFPSEWALSDWGNVLFHLTLIGIVIWKYRHADADKARFLIVLLAVTLGAVVGTMLAERLPYAMLLQGQPYRALWLASVLHFAFAFWLCAEWSQRPCIAFQWGGCALLGYLCCANGLRVELMFPLCLLPIVVIALRGLEREPRQPAWLLHSVQASLVLGAVAWVAYKYVLLLSHYGDLERRQPELIDVVEIFLGNLGPIMCIGAVAVGLVRLGPAGWRSPAFRWLSAGASLSLQICCFVLPATGWYQEHCTQYRADLYKMRAFLDQQRRPTQPLPTVYSNLGCLDYVWVDLHAKSYFDWWQAGGFMFRREMAVEGQRRACLVAPFEMARFGKWERELSEGDKEVVARLFQTEFNTASLSKTDLTRLCQEPDLDYVLIEQRFDGLSAVQHGRLYLYSCQKVRMAVGLPNPHAHDAIAAIR